MAAQRAELPVGSQGAKSPEAESSKLITNQFTTAKSSIAFQTPAEVPNLTLVTDSFWQFI